jgi:beta-glucanase (GH16 family)
MSTRNLTDQSPIINSNTNSTESDDSEPRNPFIQDELNSYDDSNSSQDSTAQLQGKKPTKPFIDYQGYYRNQGSSNSLTRNEYSSSNISGMNQSINNEVHTPPEYDRYPSIGGSRIGSMATSITSNSNLLNAAHQKKHSVSDRSSNSEASSNPFLVDADFSPFGGYPASSFPLHIEDKEDDDYLHNPDPIADEYADKHRFMHDWRKMDKRSAGGYLGLLFLFLGAIVLFILLPVLTYSGATDKSTAEAEVYEVLTLYQYPTLSAIRTSLVDPDTPESALTKESKNGDTWSLVFSDEFNAEGRTFYDGDDQFWQGVDIHYDATKDLEWYDPDAATTSEGTLNLRMDAFQNHNLFYRSAMLQSWNRMCFSQGNLEVSAMLPNYGNVSGLWPGIWTLGNLARPGYLATSEGVWPYSYEACDAGITPNQSSTDGISYLSGQKLSVCTCDDEDHPNQGTGRGATEIDALEGSIDTTLKTGVVSQSLQVAPYDIWYMPDYDYIEIYNQTVTTMNTYAGGPFQQAVSGVSTLNTKWYEFGDTGGHYYQKYGFEYLNDDDDGYCMWFVGDDPTFTLYSTALHPNGNVDWRRISKEPMSIILNLGVSNNWAYIDWPSILFPSMLRIDYVRLYQPSDAVDVTCDPSSHPTYDYIMDHRAAYFNPNATSWTGAGYDVPKNILTGNCKSSKYSS